MIKLLGFLILSPVIVLTVLTNGRVWLWESDDLRGIPEALIISQRREVVKTWHFAGWAILFCKPVSEQRRKDALLQPWERQNGCGA